MFLLDLFCVFLLWFLTCVVQLSFCYIVELFVRFCSFDNGFEVVLY